MSPVSRGFHGRRPEPSDESPLMLIAGGSGVVAEILIGLGYPRNGARSSGSAEPDETNGAAPLPILTMRASRDAPNMDCISQDSPKREDRAGQGSRSVFVKVHDVTCVDLAGLATLGRSAAGHPPFRAK